jgi:hypothetical protein
LIDTAETTTLVGNPYVGPRSLKVGEEIFGRDREKSTIHDQLLSERIMLLYSPSGAGKTSLLDAGLRPMLDASGLTALPTIRVVLESSLPASTTRNRYALNTLRSLEATSTADCRIPDDELVELRLADYFGRLRESTGTKQFCLVFDQFEELFTNDPTDESDKAAYLDEVGEALRDRDVWAIFAMREEYIAHLDPYLRFIPTKLRCRFRLDLLRPPAARDAIRKPAHALGVDFKGEAADNLIENLRQKGPWVEPVHLQVVCSRLWDQERDDPNAIGLEDLKALGNLSRPLAQYYDEQVKRVAEESGIQEGTIRSWIDRDLITSDKLRRKPTTTGPAGEGGAVVLRLLDDAHIIRQERRRDGALYELAHDRLVSPIQESNADWRDAHLQSWQRNARQWAQDKTRHQWLLTGSDLKAAKEWARTNPDGLEEVDSPFLDACRARERRRRRGRIVVSLVGFFVVAGLVVALVIVKLWRNAVHQKIKAQGIENALQWFMAGQNTGGDITTQLEFDRQALSSYESEDPPPAFILRAVNTHLVSSLADSASYFSQPATMSADGTVAAAAIDGRIHVIGINSVISAVDFADASGGMIALNRDGSMLATLVYSDLSASVQIFDTRSHAKVSELSIAGRDQSFASLARMRFSDDGATLLAILRTDLSSGELRVWDVFTGTDQTPPNEMHSIFDVRGAGGRLVTIDQAGAVQILDATSGEEVEDLSLPSASTILGLSEDGRRVALSTDDGAVVVNDGVVDTLGVPALAFAFGPDGGFSLVDMQCALKSWSAEGTFIDTARIPLCTEDFSSTGFYGDLSFDNALSQDGTSVLLQTFGRSAVISTSDAAVHLDTQSSVALAADRSAVIELGHIVTVTDDEGTELWTKASDDFIVASAFSDDGQVLFTATRSSVRAWDGDTGVVISSVTTASSPIQLASSADGSIVVIAGETDVWRWGFGEREQPEHLVTRGQLLTSVAVTSDGTVLTGTNQGVLVYRFGESQPEFRDVGPVIALAAGTSDQGPIVIAVDGPINTTTDGSGFSGGSDFPGVGGFAGQQPIDAASPDEQPAAQTRHLEVWNSVDDTSSFDALVLQDSPTQISVSRTTVALVGPQTLDVYRLEDLTKNELTDAEAPVPVGGADLVNLDTEFRAAKAPDTVNDQVTVATGSGSVVTLWLDAGQISDMLSTLHEQQGFELTDADCQRAVHKNCD